MFLSLHLLLFDHLTDEHDFLHRVLDETNHPYTVNIGSFTGQPELANKEILHYKTQQFVYVLEKKCDQDLSSANITSLLI